MKNALIKPARFAVHRLREAGVYAQYLRGGSGKKLLVLQNGGRQMSSLLRGYEISDNLRSRGWNSIVIPKQLELSQRRRVLRLIDPDVVLLLSSRDPKNSHELLSGYRYFYDLDDADFFDPKLTDRIIRDVQAAAGVIAGSRFVANWCRQYNSNVRVVWTGSRPTQREWTDHTRRSKIITWAQSDPIRYPVEFDFVVGILEKLSVRRRDFKLRLYGGSDTADSGRSKHLRSLGIDVEWMPFMSYPEFIASLDDVAVGFSPICAQSEFSKGKSFGKILAYLDARVPVVTSDEVDHALFFEPRSGVVSNDPDVWVDATDRLLGSPDERNRMSSKAFENFQRRLSLEKATDLVEAFVGEQR